MGWSSANRIFNPVAHALITAGVDDETKRTVLGGLIKGLQSGDWDTEDESLEDFLDEPAIVAAFADHNVHLSDRRCCRMVPAADARAALMQLRPDDWPEEDMAARIDAYAHELAERIRAHRDEIRGATQATIVMDFAADLIDPAVQK